MDFKLLISTFIAILIAELGDKTQLAVLTFSASSGKKWEVFFGAFFALGVASLGATLIGGALSHILPPEWMRRIAGIIFIAMGLWFFFHT